MSTTHTSSLDTAHSAQTVQTVQTAQTAQAVNTLPAAKKVYIRTFGCQMNEYDSDKMADVLRAAEGYEPTPDPEQAGLIAPLAMANSIFTHSSRQS